MNVFTWVGLILTLLGFIFTYYGGVKDLELFYIDSKEKEFKNMIDTIVYGDNWYPYFENFEKLTASQVNDEQLKYIYETVSKYPFKQHTNDFLYTILNKKSIHAQNFYLEMLKKSAGLTEVQRPMIYNCFQNINPSLYETELKACILRSKNPIDEFITTCTFFAPDTGYNKLLNNMFNDKVFINSFDKIELMKVCSHWNDLNNNMNKLKKIWEKTYIETVFIPPLANGNKKD